MKIFILFFFLPFYSQAEDIKFSDLQDQFFPGVPYKIESVLKNYFYVQAGDFIKLSEKNGSLLYTVKYIHEEKNSNETLNLFQRIKWDYSGTNTEVFSIQLRRTFRQGVEISKSKEFKDLFFWSSNFFSLEENEIEKEVLFSFYGYESFKVHIFKNQRGIVSSFSYLQGLDPEVPYKVEIQEYKDQVIYHVFYPESSNQFVSVHRKHESSIYGNRNFLINSKEVSQLTFQKTLSDQLSTITGRAFNYLLFFTYL